MLSYLAISFIIRIHIFCIWLSSLSRTCQFFFEDLVNKPISAASFRLRFFVQLLGDFPHRFRGCWPDVIEWFRKNPERKWRESDARARENPTCQPPRRSLHFRSPAPSYTISGARWNIAFKSNQDYSRIACLSKLHGANE